MATITALPTFTLAGLLFYGGFSRFTNGQFTPAFYAYQVSRSPDDGSTVASLLPVVDTVLGSLLAFSGRKWKRAAAIFAAVAQGAAIVGLYTQGRRDLWVDVGVCALAVAAAFGTSVGDGKESPARH